ncbi:hypothetical protein Prubr_52830 [Polymorphospora rubra]|uniref:Uncharacterized protein n=1 Tax=Polymorphospora rubra TaxID=338584 RepID=A0A810N462_9ACTN|nr:hypothetical protein Prubr_52830 [Polymorphospora rubra]
MLTVKPGLADVVAFDTQIAEPDRAGGSLRYRGVDIEKLVGHATFADVWGLLVDGDFTRGLPAAEPFPIPVHSGDIRVDVQAATAMVAPYWGLRPLIDIDDAQAREDLARTSVMMLSFVAQAARGARLPAVPQRLVNQARTVTERFMIRWQGEPDPRQVEAIDRYWVCAAEHGMNASTFTGRVVASTGADVAACLSAAVASMSGPLHGGAPARVLGMVEDVEKGGDARAYVRRVLDSGRRLMGFGHAIYRAEDPGRGSCGRRRGNWPPPGSRWPSRWRTPPWPNCASASRTGCSRPTWSSGPRSCWTSRVYRRSCSRRCSPVPGRPGGARTSWSRSGSGS